jgi:hypothetical protein
MRAVGGFVLLHVGLIVVGLALLRALRLLPARPSALAMLAAIGPAALVGVCAVIPVQIVLLVIGVPLTPVVTVIVGGGWVALAAASVTRAGHDGSDGSDDGPATLTSDRRLRLPAWIAAVVAAVGLVYLAVGGWAVSRLPTVLDDARIWSLRGLTLTYYHHLQPLIFQNQGQSGGHPVYPLLQPALEAIVSQSMGSPQLRLFHTELWLLLGAVIWTAAYLLARRRPDGAGWAAWSVALALLALTPAVVVNISMGYANITASALLASGVLALGLWVEGRETGHLGMAALFFAAAANGKDEDLLATVLVVVAVAVIVLSELRHAEARDWFRTRGLPLLGAVAFVAVMVLPWRVWTVAHHLTEGGEPSLPHALTPAFLSGRSHQFTLSATAMLTQTLGEYGWLAAVFLVACLACLVTKTQRPVAALYLLTFLLLVAAMLWLYTTTSIPLSFLIPTSMNRTVDVFMVPAALSTAHLISLLVEAPSRDQATQPTADPSAIAAR